MNTIKTIRLILGISLIFFAGCGGMFPPQKVPGFRHVNSEKLGTDIKGNRITRSYYENEKSLLTITTTPYMKVKGKVVAVGNATMPMLILQTNNKDAYYFRPEDKDRYWKKQGEVLELYGKVEERSVKNRKTGKILTRKWIYPEK